MLTPIMQWFIIDIPGQILNLGTTNQGGQILNLPNGNPGGQFYVMIPQSPDFINHQKIAPRTHGGT